MKKLSVKIYSWTCTTRPQIGKWWEDQHHKLQQSLPVPTKTDLQGLGVNSHDPNFVLPKPASLLGVSCRRRCRCCSDGGWVTSFLFPPGSVEVRGTYIHQLRTCLGGWWELLPLQGKPLPQATMSPPIRLQLPPVDKRVTTQLPWKKV